MPEFKEMIIRQTPNGILPQLPLNGKWLEELGFIAGTAVHATYKDACLTLTPFNTSSINYTSSVLCVTSKPVRKRPRTYLVLEWWLLRKCGFNVGDRLGLSLSQNMIQIIKINRFVDGA